MKVTLLHPLLVINKGNHGAVCRMSPHKILGPPFWLGTKDKEETHGKPNRHKWERDTRRIEKGGLNPGEGGQKPRERQIGLVDTRERQTQETGRQKRQGRGGNQKEKQAVGREKCVCQGRGDYLQVPGQ